MLRRLSNAFYNKLSTRMMLIAIGIFVLFVVLAYPPATQWFAAQTGTGDMPDTLMFATPSQLYDLAQSYGVAGRAAYIKFSLLFDIAWPALYGFLMLSVLTNIFRRLTNSKLLLLNLLPLLGVALDLTENLLAMTYMAVYPSVVNVHAYVLAGVTVLKWGMLGLCMVMLIGRLCYNILCKINKKSNL